jgi:hypothetical protein
MQRRWWVAGGAVGLVLLAASAVAGFTAMSQAARAKTELAASRDLLARASGLAAGTLSGRLDLLDQASVHAETARAELTGGPVRVLGSVPLLGRDVRVAQAVATTAVETVRETRQVVTALEPIEARPPTGPTLKRASAALLELHGVLDRGHDRVRQTRPLVVSRDAREQFLTVAASSSRTAFQAGHGLRLAARLYGPPGSSRYFLAFQNPAELRGTGGLIGEYGILESSPQGPRMTRVASYGELDQRIRTGVDLPAEVAPRYDRYPVGAAFWAVNIPPDLPTVGRTITQLYQQVTGTRVDGVIAVDPLAVAEILRVGGPISVGGTRLDSDNVAQETLVHAYARYAQDNEARRRYLQEIAKQSLISFGRAMSTNPIELVKGLATAAKGRHLQLYSTDKVGQRALLDLGIAGSATAPHEGDYVMPVGVNTASNKMDAFLRRNIRYQVKLQADGGAKTYAAVTLRNAGPPPGLPRYVVGPYDSRFRAGENSQLQTLYVAGEYGFLSASVDGRPVGAEAVGELGGLALSQPVTVPARHVVTVAYVLLRRDAMEALDGDRRRYRLLLRPQATVWPDLIRVSVTPPPGWRFGALPPRFRMDGPAAVWSGPLDREQPLAFELVS